MSLFLPAEWHEQAFVQMTWPHQHTDWAPVLDDAIECFCNIAREIAQREPLLIVAQYPEEARAQLEKRGVRNGNISLVACETNDTWARDHAFITCIDSDEEKIVLKDFQFNGWGMKFAADKDNLINQNLTSNIMQRYGEASCRYDNRLNFVFEGGSVESDGNGTLMVTSSCLLSRNRNNTMSQQDIELYLKKEFNADRVFWLEHSWLAGDDTDGHIDTVARFCSEDSIAYVKCYEPADEHYEELTLMEQELKALRTKDGQPYKLFPLPLPDPCCDDEGQRLPATHANFLIINHAVLVPTYGQHEKDNDALEQLKKAFPRHEIVGVDCRVLIIQHGSLHCSTMQFPAWRTVL